MVVFSSGVKTNTNAIEYGEVELTMPIYISADEQVTTYEAYERIVILQGQECTMMLSMVARSELAEPLDAAFGSIADSVELYGP